MKMPIYSHDADRLGLALMNKLGVDPAKVSSGSIVVEWNNETAVITWQGFATMSPEEFIELWDETRMREAPPSAPPPLPPEPTRDEIAQHLDLVHRWQPPQSFYTMSTDNLRGIHDGLHDHPSTAEHGREDWAS